MKLTNPQKTVLYNRIENEDGSFQLTGNSRTIAALLRRGIIVVHSSVGYTQDECKSYEFGRRHKYFSLDKVEVTYKFKGEVPHIRRVTCADCDTPINNNVGVCSDHYA